MGESTNDNFLLCVCCICTVQKDDWLVQCLSVVGLQCSVEMQRNAASYAVVSLLKQRVERF